MSSLDDRKIPDEAPDRLERSKSGSDHSTEINSRFGVSKEAARKEMDRFRGIAEYETRKIFGQRSALKRDLPEPHVDDSVLPQKKSPKSASESQAPNGSEQHIEILEHAAGE